MGILQVTAGRLLHAAPPSRRVALSFGREGRNLIPRALLTGVGRPLADAGVWRAARSVT